MSIAENVGNVDKQKRGKNNMKITQNSATQHYLFVHFLSM